MRNNIAHFIQQNALITYIIGGVLFVAIFAAGVFTEHLTGLAGTAGTLLVGFVLALMLFGFLILGAGVTFLILATVRKDWWYRDLAARFILPSLFAAIGLILGLATSPQGMAVHWAILVTVFSAIIGWVVDDILRWANRERKIDKDIEWIRDHLTKLSVYYAFHTENNRLENLLDFSQTKLVGRTRWLIPFFISRKLNEDLKEGDSKITFKIKPEHYSELLTQLIPLCSSSIYMSCPYSPTEWFDKLFEDKHDLRQAAKDVTLAEEKFPPHIRQLLLLSSTIEKKRFVVIPKRQIDKMCSEIGDLQTFLKYSDSGYKIDTRFVAQEKLCDDCKDSEQCMSSVGKKPCERDFQIWDGKVSIEYDFDTHQCTLSVGPEGNLDRLFEYCWKRQGVGMNELKSITDMLTTASHANAKLEGAFKS